MPIIMTKWFDANGVDVDAYPDRAFRGGVYDGGILGKRSQTMTVQGSNIVNRVNPTGLKFQVFSDPKDKNRTQVSLVGKGTSVIVKMTLDEFTQCWYRWQMQGQMIQIAFPTVPKEVREFFLTGITPAEWDAIFAGTDHESESGETSSAAYERYLKNFPLEDPRD